MTRRAISMILAFILVFSGGTAFAYLATPGRFWLEFLWFAGSLIGGYLMAAESWTPDLTVHTANGEIFAYRAAGRKHADPKGWLESRVQ